MNNEVEIVVKATDRGAKQTLAGVGESAKRMSKDFDSSSPGVRKLRSEFDDTAASVRRMKAEFAKSGDMDLWKDIEGGERKLKSLKGELSSLGSIGGSLGNEVKKALKGIGEEGGKLAGQGIESGIVDSIKGLTSSPIGLIVGAAVAGPIITVVGTAVAAGITLGVGGGALAGGIALAAKDPRVSDAWGSVFDSAKNKLTAESAVMVEPLIKASRSVGSAFDEVIPKIGNAFDKLAPRITDLGRGAGDMFKNIFKGDNFDRVVTEADHMLAKLGQELPNIGNAINNFLGSIADSGAGTEKFWSDFLISTQKSIVAIGNVLEVLSKVYALRESIGKPIDNFFDKLFGVNQGEPEKKLFDLKTGTEEVGAAARKADGDFAGLMQSISGTAATADNVYGAAVDKVLNTTMGLDQATLGFAESQNRLTDAIGQNGRALDINSASGEANREAVLSVVSANIRQFDSMIKAGSSADQAREAYDANTQALQRQLEKAGFTQAQIDGLIGKYRSVPDDVSTDIQMNGLSEAINGLDDTLRRINHLDGRVSNVYINEIHRQLFADPVGHFGPNGTGGPPGQAHGGITGAASGGPRGDWTMVGEQGRELVKLPAGSQVIPHGGTEAMMGGGGAGGGAGSGAPAVVIEHLEIHALDPQSAANAVVASIKAYERGNGKGWRTP